MLTHCLLATCCREDIGTVRAFYESNLALTDSPSPKFRCGLGRC